MADELKDPNRSAHEIIEVLEDGDAIRNDGVRLTAANKNPWYVLATIYGEQEEGATWLNHDKALAEKNRSAWNRWIGGSLQATNDEVEITSKFRRRLGDETAELPSSRKKIDFSKVYFPTTVCFIGFNFARDGEFIEAHFVKNVLFNSSTFEGNAFFIKAVFQGIFDFRHARFEQTANFRSASFKGVSLFDSVQFNSNVCFQSVTFHSGTGFTKAVFAGETQFDWYGDDGFGFVKAPYAVRFFSKANFDSAKFHAKTRFTDAQFLTHVPEFHAAVLYEDTVFPCRDQDQGNWPPLKNAVQLEERDEPIPVMSAEDQKRAYNRLRLFMNKSLQLDEEQFFHRQEMRCKREIEPSKRMRLLYDLFKGVSDFGNSVLRPVGWLFVFWLSGMIAKLDAVHGGWWPNYHSILPAMGWSFANLFSFFGFQRRYFGEEELNMALKFAGGVQTVLGFVLLFFLGLGLRNRFRLR